MPKVPLYPSPQEIVIEALSNESEEELAQLIVNMANAEDPAAVECLNDVIQGEGDLEQMYETINELIDIIEVIVRPEVDVETGALSWEPELSKSSPVVTNSETGYALVLSRLSSAGIVDRLRQCHECKTYFVGDPRSRWCSKICGSRNRQRAYQAKKREDKKRATK